MDPVNKWLTVIIFFMAAVLIVIGWTSGVRRYEFKVEQSTLFQNHAVIYMLDTKEGEVRGQLVDENDLIYNGRARSRPTKVFSFPSSTYRY